MIWHLAYRCCRHIFATCVMATLNPSDPQSMLVEVRHPDYFAAGYANAALGAFQGTNADIILALEAQGMAAQAAGNEWLLPPYRF